MFEIVKSILAKQLHLPEENVTMESDIKGDLGADSLDIIELLFKVEDMYGITIPNEELIYFSKVKDIVSYLEANKK